MDQIANDLHSTCPPERSNVKYATIGSQIFFFARFLPENELILLFEVKINKAL